MKVIWKRLRYFLKILRLILVVDIPDRLEIICKNNLPIIEGKAAVQKQHCSKHI